MTADPRFGEWPLGELPGLDLTTASSDWAASGAMALTGYRDGPPGFAPGAPAALLRAALAAAGGADAVGPVALGVDVLGVGVLGERAALLGLGAQAPFSAGGRFRILPTSDGWVGLSLARLTDFELVPALVEGPVEEPWEAVARWLVRSPTVSAVERIALLGLPGAPVTEELAGPTRPPVQLRPGGPRRAGERPLVLDFTSLWAGPLCAHLLGRAGARVIKVESRDRLDGARQTPAFFDLLHAGHESIVMDFGRASDRELLRTLVGAADVVLEASRPRALRQLGLFAQTAVTNGTIWVSITAYGRTGDSGRRVGFGDDVAAGAGLVAWAPGGPIPVGDALADPLAGAVAAAATIAALRDDHATLLDVSMHDVAAWAAVQPRESARLVRVSQRWWVEDSRGRHEVSPATSRAAAGPASPAGQHTSAVRVEFQT